MGKITAHLATCWNARFTCFVLAILLAIVFASIDNNILFDSIAVEESMLICLLIGMAAYVGLRPRSLSKHKKGSSAKTVDASWTTSNQTVDMEAVNRISNKMMTFAKAGDRANAEVFLETVRKSEVRIPPSCYGTVISLCAKQNDLEASLYWLEALVADSAGKPNSISINVILGACARTKDAAKAEALFTWMEENGVQPDITTYNTLINVFTRVGRLEEAENWLGKMKEAGVEPNVVINGCERGSLVARAEYWLDCMRAAGLEPNDVCYKTLILVCAKVGNAERAIEWLEEMDKQGVTQPASLFSAVVGRLSRSRDVKSAERFVTWMTSKGLEIDTFCHHTILGAYGRSGNVEQATAYFSNINKDGSEIKPDKACCAALYAACQRRGDTHGAAQWLDPYDKEIGSLDVKAYLEPDSVEMFEFLIEAAVVRGEVTDITTVNGLLAALVRRRDFVQAQKWMERILEEKLPHNATSYAHLVRVHGLAGQNKRAMHWLAEMEDMDLDKSQAHVYGEVVQITAKLGDVGLAWKLLQRVVSAGIVVNVSVYNALISASAGMGDYMSAERYLRGMVEVGVQPDVASYSAVIHGCAKARDARRAESWIVEMHEKGVMANVVTFNAVINACAKSGDVERAETWLHCMINRGITPTVLTYNSVINACAKTGEVDRAERWFREISKLGITPDSTSYGTVIHACVDAQDPYRAEKWLEEMVVANVPTSFCYNVMAQAWARIGQTQRALHWVSVAEGVGFEVNRLTANCIAMSHAKGGKFKQAEYWRNKANNSYNVKDDQLHKVKPYP